VAGIEDRMLVVDLRKLVDRPREEAFALGLLMKAVATRAAVGELGHGSEPAERFSYPTFEPDQARGSPDASSRWRTWRYLLNGMTTAPLPLPRCAGSIRGGPTSPSSGLQPNDAPISPAPSNTKMMPMNRWLLRRMPNSPPRARARSSSSSERK